MSLQDSNDIDWWDSQAAWAELTVGERILGIVIVASVLIGGFVLVYWLLRL